MSADKQVSVSEIAGTFECNRGVAIIIARSTNERLKVVLNTYFLPTRPLSPVVGTPLTDGRRRFARNKAEKVN